MKTPLAVLWSGIFLFSTLAAAQTTSRYQHSATLLNNGTVLIAGGVTCPSAGSCSYLSSAEIYDPVSGAFTATGAMAAARSAPAVLLPDGKVLIAGGYGCDALGTCVSLSSAEIYDPATGVFTATSDLQQARNGHTLTPLKDGRVLVAGGQICFAGGFCYPAYQAEVYDPQPGTFTATSWMSAGRYDASAVLLNDGRVLIAGGFDGYSFPLPAEIYDPATDTFAYFNQPALNVARSGATATVLNNGQVLIAGGNTCAASSCPTSSAEVYDPATNTFTPSASMNVTRYGHSASLLSNGQVLIAGGYASCAGSCATTPSTEVYDSAAGAFSSTAVLSSSRAQGSATLLLNGNVLLAGGIDSGATLGIAETYQPPALTPPGLVSIAVNPASLSLIAGRTQPLTALGAFADGTMQTLHSAIWTSSDSAVASVSNAQGSSGFLLANGAGSATVTASAGTVSGTASISALAITSLTITPAAATLPVAGTQKFTATAVLSDGAIQDLSNSVVWNSSDSSVVSIVNTPGAEGLALALQPGTVTITATIGSTTAANTVTVLAPPAPSVISNVSPVGAASGVQVTITGAGFGATPGTVLLGTALASVVTWSDTQIVAAVAPGSGSGVAQVQQGDVWSNAVSFTVLTPTIAGVAPLSGAVGDQITITGSGFGAAQGTGSVLIGSATARSLSWTDSQILIAVPPGASSGNLLVQQGGSLSNAVSFTVNGISIISVVPQSAIVGAQVTMTGSGFGAVQGTGSIWLGTAAAGVVSWSDTRIVATVAQGSATGSAQVLQNGVWSAPVPFEVIAPKITAVTPNPASPGGTVTVTGTGFGPVQNNGSIWLGSAYGNVLSWSDTQIVATVASTARTGVAKVQQDGIWSNSVNLSVPLLPGAMGVNILPSQISMVVGETRSLQAFLPSGAAAVGLTWQVSDNTIANLSTDDPPTLTALAVGHVTITAGDASADLTVYPGPSLPLGTVKWSAPGDGSGVVRIIPAVPSDTGVDVFALQASGQLQAITAEGRLAWTANVGTDPNLKLLPDFQSGMVTVTPQSLMRLDGMTGQPQGLYFSNTSTRDGISSVVPHTDGTIFAVDGDTLTGINPADGTPKFSIAMEHSTTDTTNINGPWGVFCASFADPTSTHTHDEQPPAIGNLIVAGDGNAYVTYQYSTNTYTNVPCIDYTRHQERHLRLLRVSSSGDSSKIAVKDWTSDFRQTSNPANPWTTTVSTQTGIIPSLWVADLITNADQGVVVSWGAASDAYCAYSDINGQTGCVGKQNRFALTPVLGGAVGQDAVVNIPNQWSPVQPMLQAADGTYFGNVYVQDPVTTAVSSLVVATDANGAMKWSLPGDDYGLDHVGPDSTLYLKSFSRNTIITVDRSVNFTSQSADTGAARSWAGGWYNNLSSLVGVTSYDLDTSAVDSSFWPFPDANPSATRTGNFFTKEITVIGWINKAPIAFPPEGSVNLALEFGLSDAGLCPVLLKGLADGDRSVITSDADRRFVNAFLISQSANSEPPSTLDPSVIRGGDFRALNRAQAVLEPVGNQILNAQFYNTKAINGDTPDSCHSPITTLANYIAFGGKLLKSEGHPDNGKSGVTPGRLLAFYLVEGRVGPEAQAANRTINACFSKDASTGFCNDPVPPVTPYIWALTKFDAAGQYTVDHQIFPTYYIYENGKLVTKIPQSDLEVFIGLNAQSQVKASDVK